MADFVAVLRKTLDGLGETTPEVRARVYDKARSTIAKKLAAIDPPPPAAVAERQKQALEDAIRQVEAGYAKPVAQADPLAELENIFSSIDRNRNQQTHVRPATPAEPTPAKVQAAPDARQHGSSPVEPAPSVATSTATPAEPPRDEPLSPPEAAAGRTEPEAPPPFEDHLAGDEDRGFTHLPGDDPNGRRPIRFGLIAAIVALIVVAAGAYGIWINREAFTDVAGSETAETEQAEQTAAAEPEAPAEAEQPAESGQVEPAQPAQPETQKFTQRLLPDGKEVDPGPAGDEAHIGEGTSVVALTTPPGTQPPDSPADAGAQAATSESADSPATAEGTDPAGGASADQPALAVGQKAIFYEERTSTAEGSAEPGSIVWSLVQESPGADAPPEPAIRAEASIPGKDVQLRMTIRRNTDQTLPASHIIEMIFLTPEGFDGGGIDNVLRVAMKKTEQEAGSPLIGIPAKIADGFFLIALNDTKADEQANLTLLRNQDWIDIPVVYKSGRRALLTMEKGIPGANVFDEALKAWQAKTSG